MDNTWQLVHSDGEIIDADDVSSVSSDWSVMDGDQASENGEAEYGPATLEQSQRLSSSPDQYDDDDGEGEWRDPPCRQRKSRKQRGRRSKLAREPRASSFAVSLTTAATPSASALSNQFALLAASAAQRNPHKSNRPPKYNNSASRVAVDKKHNKCLFNGAMIGRGHQRPQVFRSVGGQVLRSNKVRA